MIGHFPTPYPDEAFYSICWRYQKRVQYTSIKSLNKELFGSKNASLLIDFPGNLSFFVNQLPKNDCFTIQNIINNLTFVPYYEPFANSEILKKTKKQMINSNGNGIHSRLGLMASRIKATKFFRFCLDCKKDDLKEFGETYLHRAHQIAGVQICWKHKRFLNNSSLSINDSKYSFEWENKSSSEVLNIDLSESIVKHLEAIALQSHKLLTGNYSSADKRIIAEQYKKRLIKKDLVTLTGSVRVKKLLEEFTIFYSTEFLNLIGCEFAGSPGNDDNWLLRILRKPKSVQHPLYHILLLNFLDVGVDEFFDFTSSENFFGDPPWLCLNPATEHYRKPVITQFKLGARSRNGRIAGHFKCECEFEFVRSGPDITPNDQYRIDKIINFGKTWEQRLCFLLKDKNLRLSDVARSLQVDPMTIKRHTQRLGLSLENIKKPYKSLAEKDKLKNDLANTLDTREEKRNEWMELLKTLPQAKLIELRKLKAQTYAWLRNNDEQWLKENLPVKLKSQRSLKVYIDWKKRDRKILQLITKASEEIMSDKIRPKQVTKTALGKKADCLAFLLTKLEKLPLTKEKLMALVENREEYAIRRVKWVAKTLRDKDQFYNQTKLINNACVRSLMKNKLIIEAVEHEITLQKKNANQF